MHAKATFVFWTTLILYLITLFTVSYVGVYLTYIAIPMIVISGLIMKFAKPKPKYKEMQDNVSRTVTDALEATSSVLQSAVSGLESMTEKGEMVTEKLLLIQEKTQPLKSKKFEIKLEIIQLEGELQDLEEQMQSANAETCRITPPTLSNGHDLLPINDTVMRRKVEKLSEIQSLQKRMAQLDLQIEAIKQACEDAVNEKYAIN
ncbi:hypothetical protein [Vibrio alfacsensis]|uniref:hypothetical protein n=1 Tax=Vibrio TaxID=662 RepID=UPI004067EFF5